MIRLENASYRYPGAQSGCGLDSVNLTIHDGEWVAVAGGNGSGKTTLCRLIAGLYGPTSGTVEIDGRPIGDSPRGTAGEPRVGIAFQDPDSQFVTSSVRDEIVFGMENIGLDRTLIESRCGEALALFGLERYRQRNPHMLSGGEKQRLILAALRSMGPRHLVLDEPFSFLDHDARETVLGAMRETFRDEGRTIVCSTVTRAEVDLAERVLFMEKGVIRFDGRPADLERALSTETLDNALAQPRPGSPGAVCGGGHGAADRSSILVAMDDVHLSPEGGDFDLHIPSFELARGESVGVFGASGSGKTTFLLGCSGLSPPRKGSLSLFGDPIASRRDFPAGRVAYLFQTPEQGFFAPAVREEVALGYRNFFGRAHEGTSVAQALESVGLSPESFLGRNPFHLSQGEKRLVALASALVLGAPLLILDEPTIFLDGRATHNLLATLGRLAAAGTSIVVASHERRLLESFAGRIVVLEGGTVR